MLKKLGVAGYENIEKKKKDEKRHNWRISKKKRVVERDPGGNNNPWEVGAHSVTNETGEKSKGTGFGRGPHRQKIELELKKRVP